MVREPTYTDSGLGVGGVVFPLQLVASTSQPAPSEETARAGTCKLACSPFFLQRGWGLLSVPSPWQLTSSTVVAAKQLSTPTRFGMPTEHAAWASLADAKNVDVMYSGFKPIASRLQVETMAFMRSTDR